MVSVSRPVISPTGSPGSPAASGNARSTWHSASTLRMAFSALRSSPSPWAAPRSLKVISA